LSKIISGNEEWVQNRKSMLKLLKTLKVSRKTDRLEILRSWITVHNILNESLLGWAQWLNSIGLMEQIDRKTLKEMFQTYKEFTEAFLEFDIEATGLIDKKLKRRKKSKKEKTPEYAV